MSPICANRTCPGVVPGGVCSQCADRGGPTACLAPDRIRISADTTSVAYTSARQSLLLNHFAGTAPKLAV